MNYGQGCENSVFECILDASQALLLKDKLLSIIDETKDSLSGFIISGNNYETKVEHYGAKESYKAEGVLMV